MDVKIALKNQLHTNNHKRYAKPLKGIFYLYGKHNSGKSSALAWLAFSLVYGSQGSNVVQQEYNSWRNTIRAKGHRNKNTLAFPDIRVIVPYKETYIYISLYGDDLKSINKNISFFEGNFNYKKVYFLDGMGLRQLKQSEQDYYNMYSPTVLVSACFYTQSVEAPLRVFEQKNHRSTQMTCWTQMPYIKVINNLQFHSKINKLRRSSNKMIKI